MQRLLIGFLSLFLVFGGSSAAKATAIILDSLPSPIFVGDTFDVNLVASGFGDLMPLTVAEYSFRIDTGSLMEITGVIFAGALGAGSSTFVDPVPDPLVEFSESTVLTDAALDAIQPDEFVLATVSFEAVKAGTDVFSAQLLKIRLTGKTAIKFKGTLQKYRVQAQPVPEPATFFLLLAGLAALAAMRRFVAARRLRGAAAEQFRG